MTSRIDPSYARGVAAALAPAPIEDDETALRVCAAAMWSAIVEPGDGTAGAMIAVLGPHAALERTLEALESPARTRGLAAAIEADPVALSRALERWRPRASDAVSDGGRTAAVRAGARILLPRDAAWPAGLDDLGVHAPVCLWFRGALTAARGAAPSIAVVGARAATGYGEYIGAEIAAGLATRGATIVSGAAYGIDGVAHRAALSVDGTTFALLAGGVDRPYPAGHDRLIAQIIGAGAVASEVPCGTAPTRWRFLQRNRLIAAIADATVVVEAGWRSGSLNTAGHAAALGRPLGAVPGPVTSAASAGCHRLLREFGAQCITTADDAAELIGIGAGLEDAPRDAGSVPASRGMLPADQAPRGRLALSPESARPGTSDRTRVIDALGARVMRDVEDIARRSGMSPEEVRGHLGLLELEGAVETDGVGWRRVASGRAG